MLPLYKPSFQPSTGSPDVYKLSYVQFIGEAPPYSRPDNPLLITETGHDLGFCRQLSGDEIFFGLRLPAEGTVGKVKLMKYRS